MIKENIEESLKEHVVTVVFTKKNGEKRVMNCTTNLDTIPSESHPKGTGTQNWSDEAKRVFDVDKQEWRSFRWDSVMYDECSLKTM